MKILNIEPVGYSKKAKVELEKLGELTEATPTREELIQLIPEYDVLIVRLAHKIDRKIIEAARLLKVIVTATTGLNHIDLNAAEQHGIKILSLRGETSFLQKITSTAELTMGLILSLTRKIPQAHQHVLSTGWDRDSFKGHELRNKTLGIVGFGRLGRIVARYGKAFFMNVVATDPFVNSAPHWVRLVELEELLATSDIISLHVNLSEKTRNFFGREQFQLIKKKAIFINTSRGELVDESALIEALESGQISGAGIDVLTGETSGSSHWLQESSLWKYAKKHNNIILTPHIGGATYEAMEETELFMVNKLKTFLENM